MAKNTNEETYLTPHFTLEEMTRTNVELGYMDRQRQTQPDEQVVENLTRVNRRPRKDSLRKNLSVPIICLESDTTYGPKKRNLTVISKPSNNWE